MAGRISTRVESIDRDIKLILEQDLTPEARGRVVGEYAREQLADAQQINQRVLGRIPPHKKFVDGREGAAEESVRSIIVYEFELVSDVLVWISDELIRHSPFLHGGYKKSHTLYADGSEVPVSNSVPVAGEYVFLNTRPYARRIEHGSSKQAPDGVYELVANLARKRFGNIAKIEFNYRATINSTTTPAAKGTSTARAQNKSEVRSPAIIVRIM